MAAWLASESPGMDRSKFLSHWPEVVEYAGKLAAALRDENLNEWRNLVSDAKPFLEEATHLASRLGLLKHHLLAHAWGDSSR
jgi:hypothetical protein